MNAKLNKLQTEELMRMLAKMLDEVLNANTSERTTGFVLLTFPFGQEDTAVNYIGNGERETVKTALKKCLEQWEGHRIGGMNS